MNINIFIYIGISMYIVTIITNLLFGFYPSSLKVELDQKNKVVDILNSADELIYIDNNTWAIKKFRSNIWKSDRLSILDYKDHFLMKGRKIDLELLVNKLKLR